MPRLAFAALADIADDWSRDWFAGDGMHAAGALVRIDARGELRKTQWHAHAEGLAIGISASGVAALGAQVLGVPVVSERSAADGALLESIGGECLEDLKRRSAILLHLSEKGWIAGDFATSAAVYRLEIAGQSRNPVLTLQLSTDLFVALVKAKMPPAPTPAPLDKSAQALGALPVSLSALLGRSTITVAELAELATGDVLVLDRALDAPLPLAIGGICTSRGSCTVSDDGAALKITQALIG